MLYFNTKSYLDSIIIVIIFNTRKIYFTNSPQASINVLLMAILHLIFYVPLAFIRVIGLFATAMNATLALILALNGATFLFYGINKIILYAYVQ